LSSELALCYYPTKVALVDDNAQFLNALSDRIGKNFNLCSFDDPRDGLSFANQSPNHLEKYHSDDEAHDEFENMVTNTLNKPGIIRNESERFNELSVVIVDYHMPHLNGLEFCQQLQNPNLKKILLTSRISDVEVIQAFNEGLINYYVFKNNYNMVDELNQAIGKLQHDYFCDLSRILKSRAVEGGKAIFSDPILSRHFSEVCKKLDVCEYYFVAHPSRYILRTRKGEEVSMLIYSHEELDQQLTVLKEEDAPARLIAHIQSGKFVPFFNSMDGYYEPENFSRDGFLVKAHVIEGKQKYFCALYAPSQNNPNTIPLNNLISTYH